MKYIVGSFIISFGILIIVFFLMASMNLKAPEGSMKYIAIGWVALAAMVYPFAKKIIRE